MFLHLITEDIYEWERSVNCWLWFYTLPVLSRCMDSVTQSIWTARVQVWTGDTASVAFTPKIAYSVSIVSALMNRQCCEALWLCCHSVSDISEWSRCDLKFQDCPWNRNPSFYLVMQPPLSSAPIHSSSPTLHLFCKFFWDTSCSLIEQKD